MPDLPSNQSTDFTAGSGIQLTFTETEGVYWDIAIASTGGSGHTIQDDDTAKTARTNLSFQDGFVVTDDAVGDQTELDLSYEATPSTQAFGDSATAGTAITVTRGDHKHAMMADPVPTHAAAADPHTGYRLETADHTHATTGAQAGQLDHGLALTGLTDDDHTQYRLESADHTHASTGAQAGQLDHGLALTGLTDDDHTQYRLESADHTHQSTGLQAGQLDHGLALTGLTDDDHTQYQLETAVQTAVTFSKEGTLAVGTGTIRWYNDTGRTLTFASVRASVGTAPTGATLIVDVNKDGTTIYTTQASRPTIAISGFTDEGDAPDVTTIADLSYLTVDIDQVGSTVAGADLSVTIWMTG